MKTKVIYLMAMLMLSIVSANAQKLYGTVISVQDGDTFTMLVDESIVPVKVRLFGVDAPELKQAYGVQALNFVEDYLLNKDVIVEVKGKDIYDRMLGVVSTTLGDNINELLLTNGLAWHYVKYYNSNYYESLQEQAKNNKIGIWSDEKPIEPWVFRRQQRKSKQ